VEAMQRAAGAVRIGVQGDALDSLFQSGCLRACFPRRHGGPTEAVVVNTAGGIADGDQLSLSVAAEDGAQVVVTTPSAERVYRARQGADAAHVRVTICVGPGARVAYLPQETILFDRCRLHRTLDVELDEQGSYLGVEALVFGRQESAETIAELWLRDTMRLRQGGRLLLQDGVRLCGDVRTLLACKAGAGGNRGVATIVYAAADAASRLNDVRDALADTPRGGASTWNGILVARILAEDGKALRNALVKILSRLTRNPLPRVWTN
jgi:urease accessory protein